MAKRFDRVDAFWRNSQHDGYGEQHNRDQPHTYIAQLPMDIRDIVARMILYPYVLRGMLYKTPWLQHVCTRDHYIGKLNVSQILRDMDDAVADWDIPDWDLHQITAREISQIVIGFEGYYVLFGAEVVFVSAIIGYRSVITSKLYPVQHLCFSSQFAYGVHIAGNTMYLTKLQPDMREGIQLDMVQPEPEITTVTLDDGLIIDGLHLDFITSRRVYHFRGTARAYRASFSTWNSTGPLKLHSAGYIRPEVMVVQDLRAYGYFGILPNGRWLGQPQYS